MSSTSTPALPPAARRRGAAVQVFNDRIVIRRMEITDPVVVSQARNAAHPELWVIGRVVDGVVNQYTLQAAMQLSETLKENTILMAILSDWWNRLSADTRSLTGMSLTAQHARALKLRADEQLIKVTKSLQRLQDLA